MHFPSIPFFCNQASIGRYLWLHNNKNAFIFYAIFVAHDYFQYSFKKSSSNSSFVHLLERSSWSMFLCYRILQPSLHEYWSGGEEKMDGQDLIYPPKSNTYTELLFLLHCHEGKECLLLCSSSAFSVFFVAIDGFSPQIVCLVRKRFPSSL